MALLLTDFTNTPLIILLSLSLFFLLFFIIHFLRRPLLPLPLPSPLPSPPLPSIPAPILVPERYLVIRSGGSHSFLF